MKGEDWGNLLILVILVCLACGLVVSLAKGDPEPSPSGNCKWTNGWHQTC